MRIGKIRYYSNCLLVALSIWASTRGRAWIANRRSLYFRGLIPHFSVFVGRGETIYQIEYVPPVSDGDSGSNYYALFDGYFQVKIWRNIGTGRSKTLIGASREAVRSSRKVLAVPFSKKVSLNNVNS